MPAAPPLSDSPDLAGRDAIDGVARCSCCERFPLVGEKLVHHAGKRRSGWVCESCEAGGKGSRLGEAISVVRIRSIGGAMNVRRAN